MCTSSAENGAAVDGRGRQEANAEGPEVSMEREGAERRGDGRLLAPSALADGDRGGLCGE